MRRLMLVAFLLPVVAALSPFACVSGTEAASADPGGPGLDLAGVDQVAIEPGGQNQMALYESGTRIKARIARTDDGAKQWSGWHDVDLNTDCTFGVAPDGKTRCLPPFITTGAQQYEDATCTKPMFYTTKCATIRWGLACDGKALCGDTTCTVFEVGSKITDAAGFALYHVDASKCVPTSQSSQYLTAFDCYHSGQQVSPSIFAEVTETIE